MLRLKLQKRFDDFEIQVDLKLRPAFTALFGASGSGKTTILNMVAGLLKPDAGEIALKGTTLFSSAQHKNVRPRNRNIGYVFQESRLFPHLGVAQNIEFGRQEHHDSEHRLALDEIAEIAGISGLLDRMPQSLSGGEKQRVALARALLASPEYLLMDEPLAALDQPTRLSFLTFLKQIHERFHLPILYVSHDIANVINFADEVVLLKNGRIDGYGPPAAVLDRITAPPLVSRQDIANVLQAVVRNHDRDRGVTLVRSRKMEFILPLLSVRVGDLVLLNIPASEIILATEEPSGLSASNIHAGAITEINRLGERVMVVIDAGESFTVEIVEGTVKRLSLEVGKQIYLIFKASSFRRLA